MNDISRPIKRAATLLFQNLNTPMTLSCEILLRYGEWDQLATRWIDPGNFLDCPSGIRSYQCAAQAADFLRKMEGLPSTFDTKAAAYDNFWKCQKKCKETNLLFEYLLDGGTYGPYSDRLVSILKRACKTIRRIMGPVPGHLSGGFGPGTCFGLEGSTFKTLADKLWLTPTVTQQAQAVFRHTVEGTLWDRKRVELGLPYLSIVEGNKFTTVAKDAKTDRGICIEPLGNLYCQLGVGKYLKERLAMMGLYVHREVHNEDPLRHMLARPRPNGQRLHNRLAEMASRDGSWATIDLSSASDTIAKKLVEYLLPPQWFSLLSSLRSPKTLIYSEKQRKDVWVLNEMFSTMGNGFTFELETIIFAALSAAVADLEIGVELFVYGDDIIVPNHASKDVIAILRSCGFIPNEKKTFTRGLFRESCGGDYFCGIWVRSCFVKKEPESPLEWISLHNEIRIRFPHMRVLLKHIVDQIPERLRCYGPQSAVDSYLHTSIASKVKRYVPRRHIEDYSLMCLRYARIRKPIPQIEDDGIYWIRTIAGMPHRIPLERWGHEFTVSLALLGVSSEGVEPRGSITGWRIVPWSITHLFHRLH